MRRHAIRPRGRPGVPEHLAGPDPTVRWPSRLDRAVATRAPGPILGQVLGATAGASAAAASVIALNLSPTIASAIEDVTPRDPVIAGPRQPGETPQPNTPGPTDQPQRPDDTQSPEPTTPAGTTTRSPTPTPPAGTTTTPPTTTPPATPPTTPPVPGPMILRDDNLGTSEDATKNFNVLNNDMAPDDGSLELTSVGDPDHGAVSMLPDGKVHYTPTPDYHGADAFTYTVQGSDGATESAEVDVSVVSVNDAPNALSDSHVIVEDAVDHDIEVLDNDGDVDGDVLTIASVDDGSHGSTRLRPGRVIGYTPDPDYAGPDSPLPSTRNERRLRSTSSRSSPHSSATRTPVA